MVILSKIPQNSLKSHKIPENTTKFAILMTVYQNIYGGVGCFGMISKSTFDTFRALSGGEGCPGLISKSTLVLFELCMRVGRSWGQKSKNGHRFHFEK